LLPPAYAWWLKRREQIREISSPAISAAVGNSQ